MNNEEKERYQEAMGSPEMEYLQHQMDFPPTPPTEDRDWKERFDAKFPEQACNSDGSITDCDYTWKDIKDFISQEITTAEARGRHETLEQLAGKTPIDTLYVPRRDGKEAVWKLVEIKPLA